ncbi:MAG: hypothetical protein NTZ14_09850 [Hyphomicrobiales bacterium]|nr:hypothetical protein [Hyphomicrobiales bacterium]
MLRNSGNLPFSLGEIDIAKLPAVLKAAREREPSGNPRIMIAKAIKERVAVGKPQVMWEVRLADARRRAPAFGEDVSERTVVKLTPDGAVASVQLPRSLRPKVDKLNPDAIVTALEKFHTSLGQNARLFEVSFNNDQAQLAMVSQNEKVMTFEVALREKLEETSP